MQTAVIIGAGPAGLTAAYELLHRTEVVPVVLEMADFLGGISRTVNYKGNRIDLGGHRFFSKSDRVMQWWLEQMPIERGAEGPAEISYQGRSRGLTAAAEGPDPASTDRVMLLRRRKSRIYFLRQFFDYPVRLSGDTIRKLGLFRMARIGLSYLRAAAFPYRPPRNLEQFFINRFGRELYRTFFQSYTEKVWGQPCSAISAEWGAQRVKGLSVLAAAAHFARSLVGRRADVAQKGTQTSLIEQFLYPKYGPGQMWEQVADEVQARGGRILRRQRVTTLQVEGRRIASLQAVDADTGRASTYRGDYFFSTMPVRDLVAGLQTDVPSNVRQVSDGLVYRDFLTVGLLLSGLKIGDDGPPPGNPLRDNWIYIQEPDVRLGRLQIFNNWSPYMVADPSTVWLGLEYFCSESDDLWQMTDAALVALAAAELEQIGFIERSAVLDATVIRMAKTYPAYFGSYERFDELRQYLDRFPNLFLLGRNGMHRYNNQDHSMLTAMVAVDNLVSGRTDHANIWSVNAEQDYHEAKSESSR